MDGNDLVDRLDALHRDSFAWALVCCRRERTEAEDVLQTAYLQVLDGRARFDGRSSFKTWLFAVIRRTAAAEHRRRFIRRMFLDRSAAARVPESAPGDAAADAEQADRATRVRAALAKIAARQREVLELVFYHELTIEEASTIMGVSVGTARTHYERGKQRLAASLNGDLR